MEAVTQLRQPKLGFVDVPILVAPSCESRELKKLARRYGHVWNCVNETLWYVGEDGVQIVLELREGVPHMLKLYYEKTVAIMLEKQRQRVRMLHLDQRVKPQHPCLGVQVIEILKGLHRW